MVKKMILREHIIQSDYPVHHKNILLRRLAAVESVNGIIPGWHPAQTGGLQIAYALVDGAVVGTFGPSSVFSDFPYDGIDLWELKARNDKYNRDRKLAVKELNAEMKKSWQRTSWA